MMNYAKPVLVLLIIAIVAAAALTFTFESTKPIIDRIKKEKQDTALQKILPEASAFEEKKSGSDIYFEGIKDEVVVGRIFRESQNGYAADPVIMLVGVSDNKVSNIEVLDQKETPGLGSKIQEDWFRDQFKGKTIADKLIPKQDIDALTGATISSKAVANAVKSALSKNKEIE